jgi:creatinine amidohydrolase
MARKVELGRMSFTEVEAITHSQAIVLLPIGVLEQHGPAGPMGADYVLAERVAVESAAQLADVYVAPTITYGYSPSFQSFAGNLGLPFEVFKAHLSAVVERLIACGWRNIVYVNSHAGNEAACEQVAREMREKHGVVMAHLFPWRIAMHFCRDMYEDVKAAYGHGAEPTISVMMALFGADVDPAKLVADKSRPLPGFTASTAKSVTHEGFEVGLYLETEILTATGTSADPAEATPAKGEEALRRIVNYCVSFLPAYRKLVTEQFSRG